MCIALAIGLIIFLAGIQTAVTSKVRHANLSILTHYMNSVYYYYYCKLCLVSVVVCYIDWLCSSSLSPALLLSGSFLLDAV